MLCHGLCFQLRGGEEAERWGEGGKQALRDLCLFAWKRTIRQDGGASFGGPEPRPGVRKSSEAQITLRAGGDGGPARSGGHNSPLNYFHSHFG